MLVTTMAIGAIGDAYVEKDDLESAISYYKKAAERQANDFTSPLFLMKLGLTYEKLGNKEDALKAYEKIKTDFVKSNEAKRIQKYIERVKL
jgi:TolA-binding protein